MKRAFALLLLVGCYTVKPLPKDAMLAGPSPFDGSVAGEAARS